MRIAIHHVKGSFSDGWIEYCKENSIQYKLINAYDSDIIQQIQGCSAFMWHYSHTNYKDALFAKQLLYSIQNMGIKVFPDFNTTWHFDDKIGQKYLFEAINASFVPTHIFYTKRESLEWIRSTNLPKVFKLRGGAGSRNVRLVKSRKEAERLVYRAFGKGFSQFNKLEHLKERFKRYRKGKDSFLGVLKGVLRLIIPTEFSKMHGREKGYVYFQDFIPNNDTDTRIVVIGNKIIGERRGCREGDFRASGSNILLPDPSFVDINCIKIAYEVSKKLKLQIGVFDFVHNVDGKPLIVEVSYGTLPDYTECEGYWDGNLVFHPSLIDLSSIIIEAFIKNK